MAKATSIKEAIQKFEKDKEAVAAATEKVELLAQVPPIERMDASLSSLKACKHLSLSTNNIEKITNLAGLDALQVLSLGRNQIKKLENLDPLAETLQELWVSYNLLERLAGVEKLGALRVLLASNNRVAAWAEVERLAALPGLEELLLAGNPLQTEFRDRGALAEYRLEVLKRLPNLKKLDGAPVEVEEREAALAARA